MKPTLKKILLAIIFIIVILLARPIGFLLYAFVRDKKPVRIEHPGYANDASRLSQTHITTVVHAHENIDSAISQIAGLIKMAQGDGKKISIAGAQHSMGGHTIYPDAIVLDMKSLKHLQFDSINNTLTAGSGALWSDIIPYLHDRGKSVSIMQSNNSFTVGGSISVNCHGWSPSQPPISSSVKSFRLVDANGELVTCSRNENPELFSLALGGYGLFGVIVDVQLSVADNKIYAVRQFVIASKDYVTRFNELAKDNPNVGMVYGRINVTKENFMEEAILSIYTITDKKIFPTLGANKIPGLRRVVFRSSANSDYGKELRWDLEKDGASLIGGKEFMRNQLMNEGVEVFENTDTNYTDILHEYFVPVSNATRFMDSLKNAIPGYKVDLLNITVRDVKKDTDTYLSYANEDMLGFVMLYNQRRNDVSSEREMERLTQRLINISLSMRGTYYLPYRLHATKAQFYRAYPKAHEFFRLKKQYDSLEVFQNKFYETYK